MKRLCELTAPASKQETLNIFVFYEEDIFIKKNKNIFLLWSQVGYCFVKSVTF